MTLKEIYYSFGEYEYGIAYRKNECSFYYLKPDKKYWYADPIPYKYEDNLYVFMEIFDRSTNKGCIGLSTVDLSTMKISEPQIIIEEDFHMSFPFVFEFGSCMYMIPECAASNQIRVYRMKKTIYEWELYCSFDTDRHISDIVVKQFGADLLLIAGDVNLQNGFQCRTILYWIKNFLEKPELSLDSIAPHYSYADRNAGNLICIDGDEYRVIQHSTENLYGTHVTIEKCIENNPMFRECDVYKEITLEQLGISFPIISTETIGTHTYGYIDGFEIVDYYIRKISIYGLINKLRRLLRK